jgi:hypothetical protein
VRGQVSITPKDFDLTMKGSAIEFFREMCNFTTALGVLVQRGRGNSVGTRKSKVISLTSQARQEKLVRSISLPYLKRVI